MLIVLGITLVGESLNDLADPRLRARKSAGEVVGSIEDTSVESTTGVTVMDPESVPSLESVKEEPTGSTVKGKGKGSEVSDHE